MDARAVLLSILYASMGHTRSIIISGHHSGLQDCKDMGPVYDGKARRRKSAVWNDDKRKVREEEERKRNMGKEKMINENKGYGKIFCTDCKIRIKNNEKKMLFKKDHDERPAVEYSEGWRCADCASIYRQKQSYKQTHEEYKDANQQRTDEKIIRAL